MRRIHKSFIRILGSLQVALVASAVGQTAPATAPFAKFTLSKETTRITAPLRPDGSVDYAKVLDTHMSAGATRENNAFIPLLTILGPGKSKKEVVAETIQRLGMKDLPADGDYFLSLSNFMPPGFPRKNLDALTDERRDLASKIWMAEDHVHLSDWLDKNDAALDAIVAATARDHYYVPQISATGDNLIGLPSYAAYREFAQALAIRATLRVGQGKLDKAWNDSFAIHRMSRLLCRSSLLDHLLGAAFEALATKCDGVILSSGDATAAQLKTWRTNIDSLSPMGDLVEAFDLWERYSSLDTAFLIARSRFAGIPEAWHDVDPATEADLKSIELSPSEIEKVDWDSVLKQINDYYDAVVACERNKSASERDAVLKQFAEKTAVALGDGVQLRKNPDLTHRVAGIIIKPIPLAPEWRAAVFCERGAVMHELDAVGLAICAYKVDHGKYPESLSDLAPNYFKETPADPFVDKPFHYSSTAAGFVLYSVSEDQHDDAASEIENAQGQRDLVFRVGK